ncbi:MAG: acyl carrier protein [Clostridia bacterium]
MDNLEKIKTMIAEQLAIDEARVVKSANLVSDLKADSLDIMELVMDIEQEYGIDIPDELLPTISTVGDIVDYLNKL